MSAITVVFYKEESECPVLEWIKTLPGRAQAKGFLRAVRLGELGYDLKRPEADYLRNGIYELRWHMGRVNYRILYFFHGKQAVVLAHGLTKEDIVPARDIDLALRRKAAYLNAPEQHSHYEVGI